MTEKEKIIKIFFENVYGKKFDDDGSRSIRHDGREGHWLEEMLGIAANGDNRPDILGYELKKETSSKTTFGDWSPDKSIWKRNFDLGQGLVVISRDEFLRVFGRPNEQKGGRYSWSGKPTPKISGFNGYGQKLIVTSDCHIQVIYSFSEDLRENKSSIVPSQFHHDNLIIAQWSASSIRGKLESKFGENGWVKAHKNQYGVYEYLSFGDRLTYEDWLISVRNGTVFFDCGMYEGNARPYAQWRSNNRDWDSTSVDTVTYEDYLAMGL